MRFIRILAAVVFMAAGLYLSLAAHQSRDPAEERITEVLLKNSQALSQKVEKLVEDADQRVSDAIIRRGRKDAGLDTVMVQRGAPQVILHGKSRIKAVNFSLDASLLRALELHRDSPVAFALHGTEGRRMLLMRGVHQGEVWAAAFEVHPFFQAVAEGEAVRNWVALPGGEMIFHSAARHIGVQSANLKSVASGIGMLAAGEQRVLSANYQGLDGREVLGAWTVVPRYRLVVGTEWAASVTRDASLDLPFYAGVGFLALGSLVLGLSLRRHGRKTREKYQFDPARLDDDLLDYLEENRKAAEDAVRFASQKDGEIRNLEQKMHEQGAALQDAEWRLMCLEEMLDRAKGGATPKELFGGLVKVVSQKMLRMPVVYYRFSPTTFSLVPEHAAGTGSLAPNARAFLTDARLFIGNFRNVAMLSHTEAFRKWDALRRKQIPSPDYEILWVPIEAGSRERGVLAVFLEPQLAAGGVLNRDIEFLRGLAHTAAWFCEMKAQLLQFHDADRRPGRGVAGAADKPGGLPPETRA
ncbi:MAG: hypothetical protein HUU37_02810 [Bdellovibrionales bacterium]|nr:hypothetical protein [Bdellovibrionales bacterium]